MPTVTKRLFYVSWVAIIVVFAALHALNLSADFPNHTPWHMDYAKYTDEGWYGNAAIRSHLFGHWHVEGDFNPAVALPAWPFLEWVLFFFTGVSVGAARGLAVAFFFANLVLCYALLRPRGPKWMVLLALTLMVTSPFLYCFSRLAIMEPMLTTLTLAALNLAVRLPRMRRPVAVSAVLGLIFTLMLLTKTTAVFLMPSIGWTMFAAFREGSKTPGDSKLSSLKRWLHPCAARCAIAASAIFAVTFGAWMGLVIVLGYYDDYRFLFFINEYVKPPEFYWPLLSFWWSLHGSIWIDHILIPLAGILILTSVVAAIFSKRTACGAELLTDPVFGGCILAAGGYIAFMTYQNHPQPRYFALVAVFSFVIVAMGAARLVTQPGLLRLLGWSAVGLATIASASNGVSTFTYAAHPEYTFVNAARQLTDYIDQHPNGRRLLVSISGDEITLVTHVESLCDDFSMHTQEMPDLGMKLFLYQPGWWATWNVIDPGTLEDIHTHFRLEQVATFRALDDPDRNELVLFKLYPLPNGRERVIHGNNLQQPLPGDKIEIPIE